MARILVGGATEGAGATTVAVALAHRLAHAGHAVQLARLEGDARAGHDASVFASIAFAAAPDGPVGAAGLPADGEGATIIESPAGADLAALATQLGATPVLVRRAGSDASAGDALVVETHTASGGPLQLAEDRLLAGPSVGDLIAASGSRVLARSREGDSATCDHVVVGAIASDSAESYFQRFPRKAVVSRAEKVDLALAALRSGETACLILTGGSDPSPYILDRVASARDTTLLVAPGDTVDTVRSIEGRFGRSAFVGEAKIERAAELADALFDDAAVDRLLGG